MPKSIARIKLPSIEASTSKSLGPAKNLNGAGLAGNSWGPFGSIEYAMRSRPGSFDPGGGGIVTGRYETLIEPGNSTAVMKQLSSTPAYSIGPSYADCVA